MNVDAILLPDRLERPMKCVIRLGDPTSHGGQVVSAVATTIIFGKPVAVLGNVVVCPRKGHGTTTIVEGDSGWSVDGQPVALEGHKTSCGATLISTLPKVGRSYEGTGSGNSAGGIVAVDAAPVASAAYVGAEALAPAPFGSAGAARETGGKNPIRTGLGADVDKLAAKSPSLQRDLEQLKNDGWTISYGVSGHGSTANRDKKLITIDGGEKGNPIAATQSLAHEVGHATYSYTSDHSSKTNYVKGALGDEGAATLNNIKVQREMIANGGANIGIAGNPANHAAYNRAYEQFLNDGNEAAARQSIGAIFGKGEITSNTHQTYANYYGDSHDRAYPAKK